jgi:hypothetical protein
MSADRGLFLGLFGGVSWCQGWRGFLDFIRAGLVRYPLAEAAVLWGVLDRVVGDWLEEEG